MDFPKNEYEFLTIVTKILFSNVINLMYRKIILHHSHVTGEIIGFAHNFCNQKVRKGNDFFSLFAHNLSDFDVFFVMKGTRVCVWRAKNLSIGGSNPTTLTMLT